tara:strand:+ start:630 stop:1052 length:423 start_codon:yes stop_codon:yes gene_type:complete
MYVEIYIQESEPRDSYEVCRLLEMYDEWKKDFHSSMNDPITHYFSHGGFYWIKKEMWDSYEESLEYDSDDFETIGFLCVDNWQKNKKLDFLFIVEKERRKGYATKAVTHADLDGTINAVDTIQTPDGKAFLEAYRKRGIS